MPRDPEIFGSRQHSPADIATQTAEEWVIRRDRGLTAIEAKAFEEWQKADPHNAAEYSRISSAWRSLDGIGTVPSMKALASAAEACAAARRRRQRTWAGATGLLATAAVIAIAFVVWRRAAPASASISEGATKTYVVLACTATRMSLPDGSVAELNGDSRIETDFTAAERRVKLSRGEAHFEVAKNPARPFIVSAGPITVHAVGTSFNVRLTPDAIEVLVTEGKVHLGPAFRASALQAIPETTARQQSLEQPLVAGDRAVVSATAGTGASVAVDKLAQVEIDNALAWQSTRLVFNHTPLDQIVAAFNRFNSRQMVLADSSLRARTLTGIFRADNLEGFIHLLHASVDVIAEPHGDRLTFLRAAPQARP